MEQKVLRLSPSRVNDYTNCPRLYKYRAIENLPEKLSLDAERGKLVHSVLEDLFDLPRSERLESAAIELLPANWAKHQEDKPEITSAVPDEKEWLDRFKVDFCIRFGGHHRYGERCTQSRCREARYCTANEKRTTSVTYMTMKNHRFSPQRLFS